MAETTNATNVAIANEEETLTFRDLDEIKNDLDAMAEELEKRAIERQACYDKREKPTQAMDDALSVLETAYASKKQNDVFDELLETENPIKEGIMMFTYEVKKVVEEKKKLEGIEIITVSVGTKKVDINPYSIVGYANTRRKTVATSWTHMSQRLNWLLCISLGQEIGDPKWNEANLKSVSDSFMMHKIAKELTLAGELDDEGKKHPDPTSNKQMIKTLNTLLEAMVGEQLSGQNRDIAYLKNAFSKKGKALQIVTPKTKNFALVLRDVAYRIMTEGSYEMLSKQVKAKK